MAAGGCSLAAETREGWQQGQDQESGETGTVAREQPIRQVAGEATLALEDWSSMRRALHFLF